MASSFILPIKNRIGHLMPKAYLHSKKIHCLSYYHANYQSKDHSNQTHS